jgi:hypothetical protein
MKLAIREESIELINHPFTMAFSVRHLLKDGSVSGGLGGSPLIYHNLSLPKIYISTTWDHKA